MANESAFTIIEEREGKEEKEREVVQSLLFLPSTYHSPFRKERKNVLRAKVTSRINRDNRKQSHRGPRTRDRGLSAKMAG